MKPKWEWVQLGVFGVDSGLCWVGDPCYIRKGVEKATGLTWEECFTPVLKNGHKSFPYKTGYEGLGVCVTTEGDGSFPVYARFQDGMIERIVVDFCGSFRVRRDRRGEAATKRAAKRKRPSA